MMVACISVYQKVSLLAVGLSVILMKQREMLQETCASATGWIKWEH